MADGEWRMGDEVIEAGRVRAIRVVGDDEVDVFLSRGIWLRRWRDAAVYGDD